MSERRKEPRIPVLETLQVYECETGLLLGELVNLSRHGMMILGRRCIGPNRIFRVEIPFPETLITNAHSLCLGVESLWFEQDESGDQYWIGFQIIDFDPPAATLLESLITEFS